MTDTTWWDDAQAKLREAMPAYEDRPNQTAMAYAIAAALDAEESIVVQAPTATGKSLPTILGAYAMAQKTGIPTVVSTGTKALQDQYIADCKFIQEHIDPDFRHGVIKGRGAYLCQAKMSKAESNEVALGLPMSLDKIRKIAENEEILGDTDRLGFDLGSRQKGELTTSATECPGKNGCKFGETCYAVRAKEKAARAHVIIVNHALLAVDALLKGDFVEILPPYEHLFVDEAHELRGYIESALTAEMTRKSISNLASEVVSFTTEPDLGIDVDAALDKLYVRFEAMLSREKQVTLTPAMLIEVGEQLMDLIESVERLDARVAMVEVFDDEQQTTKRRLRRRSKNMVDKLRRVVTDRFEDTVRWVERDEKRGVLLVTAPMDVAPFLANAIWKQCTAVLLSATLAIHNNKTGVADFDYMIREHGLDRLDYLVRTFDCPTVFNYARDVKTLILEDLPNTRRDPAAWENAVMERCWELTKASGGRAMMLFTSWNLLNKFYEELAPRIRRELGVTVYRQGDMTSTRALADAFAADETSVLFGTKSFFYGVNVPGNSLINLMVIKNPWHYPDPLWKARCEALDARCNDYTKWTLGSFPKLQVPDMLFTLLQGYGRLKRTDADRGVVTLFDSAVTMSQGTKYGKEKVRPVLLGPITSSMDEATSFLESIVTEAAATEVLAR